MSEEKKEQPFVPYYLRNDLKHNRNNKKTETPQNRRRKSVSEIIQDFQKNKPNGNNNNSSSIQPEYLAKLSQSVSTSQDNSFALPTQSNDTNVNSNRNSNSVNQLFSSSSKNSVKLDSKEKKKKNYIIPKILMKKSSSHYIPSNRSREASPSLHDTLSEFDQLNLSSPTSSQSSTGSNGSKLSGNNGSMSARVSNTSSGSGNGNLLTPKGIEKKTSTSFCLDHKSTSKFKSSPISRVQSIIEDTTLKQRSPRFENKIENLINVTDENPQIIDGEDIFDNFFQPTIGISIDGFIITVNDSLCSLLGYDKNDLLQKHISIILHEIFLNPYNKVLLSQIQSNGQMNVSTKFIHKNRKIIQTYQEVSLGKPTVQGEMNFFNQHWIHSN
eukprot:gene867-9116_t